MLALIFLATALKLANHIKNEQTISRVLSRTIINLGQALLLASSGISSNQVRSDSEAEASSIPDYMSLTLQLQWGLPSL